MNRALTTLIFTGLAIVLVPKAVDKIVDIAGDVKRTWGLASSGEKVALAAHVILTAVPVPYILLQNYVSYLEHKQTL